MIQIFIASDQLSYGCRDAEKNRTARAANITENSSSRCTASLYAIT